MNRLLILVLLASSALASELQVPLGARAAINSRKAVQQIVVRDPSLVTVVVADGTALLEGKQSGVTGILVTYADGEVERTLVVVGDGTNSMEMNVTHAQTLDLKQSAKAQAKAHQPESKPRSKGLVFLAEKSAP
jgi:Flp pilus assembly secretin CpaC